MAEVTGIKPLQISFALNGVSRVINPTLIWDQETVLLVDAGFPGQAPLLVGEIEKAGVAVERLDKVAITHLDWDHIGGLADLVAAVPGPVEVMAHELEKPYIQGDEVFVKSTQRNGSQATAVPPFPRARVTRVLKDGEELPFCGGIVVIHAPGHTPGHICLYHKKSRTLISGDALNVFDGRLTGPNPQFTDDMARGRESLKKLANYDIQSVICYHGGLYADDVNRRIAEIAAHAA
jgi:glyoxylase-like metal-dependent hydrolase (beta-lactamase superfamily II)